MSAGYDQYKAEAERLLWDGPWADKCIMAFCSRHGIAVMNIYHAGGEEKSMTYDSDPNGTWVRCFVLTCKVKAKIDDYPRIRTKLRTLGSFVLEANKTSTSLRLGEIEAVYSFIVPQVAHV